MDELVGKVSEKTGLSPDQAKAAVEAVIGFLKEKLPAPLASRLDSMIAGEEGSSGEGLAGEAAAALGNFLAKAKEF